MNISEAPESIILNSKLNGEEWSFNSRTGLPHAGVWTFDYVHKVKPHASAQAMDEAQFMEFIGWSFELEADIGKNNDVESPRSSNTAESPTIPGADLNRDGCGSGVSDDFSSNDESSIPAPSRPVRSPCISDWQLVLPLPTSDLQNDLHERARALCTTHYLSLRQAMMLVKRIGKLYLQVDIIVSLWPRIIEWHGFDQVRKK